MRLLAEEIRDLESNIFHPIQRGGWSIQGREKKERKKKGKKERKKEKRKKKERERKEKTGKRKRNGTEMVLRSKIESKSRVEINLGIGN